MNRFTIKRSLPVLILALPSLVLAGGISLTDGGATYSATATNCTGSGGPWAVCGANGYLSYGSDISSTTLFNFSGFNNPGAAGEEVFVDAFNAWVLPMELAGL